MQYRWRGMIDPMARNRFHRKIVHGWISLGLMLTAPDNYPLSGVEKSASKGAF